VGFNHVLLLVLQLHHVEHESVHELVDYLLGVVSDQGVESGGIQVHLARLARVVERNVEI
jgi:hypothetical protein